MSDFSRTRIHSVLASAELSALGALLHGGGTVTDFQVSLLGRVLDGARSWYRSHPPETASTRAERGRRRRAERRVHRFMPHDVAAADPRRLDGIRDPRELLDDHGVLRTAVVAAVAQGYPDRDAEGELGNPDHPGHRAALLRLPGHRRALPGAA